MNRLLKILVLSVFAVFLCIGSAMAIQLGTNITIFDENGNPSSASGQDGEDGETEPGMVNNQSWDLEGFFLNGSELSMVGGYNFATGNGVYTSGDLFIDVDGNAVYGDIDGTEGNGNHSVQNTFGYDYVLDLNFSNSTYSVFELDDDSTTTSSFYQQNQGSNPWLYEGGGESVDGYDGLYNFNFITGLSDGETGFSGVDHYALTGFDLSFLGDNIDFISHFTMGCGNDNLMGSGTTAPVPEPATMLLLGIGLIGIAGIGRKKFKQV